MFLFYGAYRDLNFHDISRHFFFFTLIASQVYFSFQTRLIFFQNSLLFHTLPCFTGSFHSESVTKRFWFSYTMFTNSAQHIILSMCILTMNWYRRKIFPIQTDYIFSVKMFLFRCLFCRERSVALLLREEWKLYVMFSWFRIVRWTHRASKQSRRFNGIPLRWHVAQDGGILWWEMWQRFWTEKQRKANSARARAFGKLLSWNFPARRFVVSFVA